LINAADALCRVLYLVSPPYVFDKLVDQPPIYDDAIVFDENWQALAKLNWQPLALHSGRVTEKARQVALNRLEQRARRP